MLNLFKVKGDSLSPTLEEGDYVLTCRGYCTPKVNDLVVVNHPVYQRVIKRVVAISPEKALRLSGDNSRSVSSEQMGWIGERWILGKVLLIFCRKRTHTLSSLIKVDSK